VQSTRSLFRNQIDKLMTPFRKTKPEFYTGYFAARVIVNRAATQKRAGNSARTGGSKVVVARLIDDDVLMPWRSFRCPAPAGRAIYFLFRLGLAGTRIARPDPLFRPRSAGGYALVRLHRAGHVLAGLLFRFRCHDAMRSHARMIAV
jgi:hypothetical protein